MTTLPTCTHSLAVHGLIVDLRCEAPQLNLPIHRCLGEFAVSDWPDGFSPVTGIIRPYDEGIVLRHLSPRATLMARPAALCDIYEDGARYWIVDDRWGLAEINLLKGQWQSWVLPELAIDPYRIVQDAVIWPLAQLLRCKGLHLVPAVSVARDGWGMLLICPFAIEPELSALIRAGFRIISQQWTALREEDGQIAMLHVPGMTEQMPAPRLRGNGSLEQPHGWIDLTQTLPGSGQNHAFCDTVLVIEPGRRALPSVRSVNRSAAPGLLRQAWPIIELHPERRTSLMANRLAAAAKVHTVTLSRRPEDLLKQLDQLRYGRTIQPGQVQVQTFPAQRIPA